MNEPAPMFLVAQELLDQINHLGRQVGDPRLWPRFRKHQILRPIENLNEHCGGVLFHGSGNRYIGFIIIVENFETNKLMCRTLSKNYVADTIFNS